MSNGKDKPGEFRTVTREGKTEQQFQMELQQAKQDGYELQVAVFYKDKH